MSQQHRFGFIGAGRMATALARGFVASGLASADDIVASDVSSAATDEFRSATGSRIAENNPKVAAESDVVFLAVKPQQMAQVLRDLRGKLTSRHLVASIAAGVPLAALAAGLGAGPRLVRIMPNTPCLVGQGASAYCLGPGATSADGQLVGRLLSAVGLSHELDEKLMDAVTGLSGSGPAFVYVIIEALSDGGVQMGLPRDVAAALAAQTVRARRRTGAVDRAASGCSQGRGGQSWGHDHRRTGGIGVRWSAGGADVGRGGRHASLCGIGRGDGEFSGLTIQRCGAAVAQVAGTSKPTETRRVN